MKRVLGIILWSLVTLAGLARADSIPIGQLSYLGTTPDGSSIFKVSLNPPVSISLSNLVPSIYIGDDKFTFALPTSGDFLFLTGPGTPFANCPLRRCSYRFPGKSGDDGDLRRTDVDPEAPLAQLLAAAARPEFSGSGTVDHYLSLD